MNNLATKILEIILVFVLGAGVGFSTARIYDHKTMKIALDQQKSSFDAAFKESEALKEKAEAHATDVEHETAKNLSAIETNYQQQLGEQNAKLNSALLAQRNNSKRLFVSTRTTSCSSSAVSGTATNPSVNNGETRAELPQHVAERLIRRSSLADEITIQLGQCQNALRADRQLP